jgi:hypothetical protein
MKKLLACAFIAGTFAFMSCGHGANSSSLSDSSSINVDSMVNEAKASVDTSTKQAVDTLKEKLDTAKAKIIK